MRSVSRVLLVLFLIVFVTIGVVMWGPLREARAIVGVKALLASGCRPSFYSPPRRTQEAAIRWLDSVILGQSRYQDQYTSYRDRFRDFFINPVETVKIYQFRGYHGDLGAALQQLTRLRQFAIIESKGPLPTESELTLFCTRLRSMPKLEVIELCGPNLTDTAIAPLAGHPGLRNITICYSGITPACLPTFTSMPNLSMIRIVDRKKVFTGRVRQTFQAAMPAVGVEFP